MGCDDSVNVCVVRCVSVHCGGLCTCVQEIETLGANMSALEQCGLCTCVQEIKTLRAKVSALEQRVMDLNNSLNSDPKNDLNVVCEGGDGECCVHTYTD